MKKSGFLRGMLDGLRSTVSQPTAAGAKEFLEANVEEALKPSHFQMETIVRHGFPYQPTAIAFDPIQRLIAIGTRNGTLRLLGRPGVDISVRHIPESAVLQIIFITNEGQMITICSDDSMHLWNLKSKKIEIIQSLRFQKERITSTYLAFQSKWLYLGTERGNTYVVNVETFSLSGYVINWNKAIELSRKTHPGCIIHLSECPIDSNKLLIGYETGSIVLWDLRNKCADFRHAYGEGIKSISWHSEGRQFICSHNDGSLSTWNVKAGAKPQSAIYPHSKSITTDHKAELCNPILKVEWRTVRNGEAYIMFSGGMPVEPRPTINSNQILTVIHGKSTTVLEMEHDIVDFITLCESPYEADYNEPYAIVVLLSKDLVVVDLQTPAYPCFQNPYPMDLHESPVTYCYYMANCPPDLVRAFFLVGHKQTKRSGFSEREWPINGGEWGSSTVSYAEIIITGHADGSLKFWDASSVNLQILYKMKTAKLFERPKAPPAHYILPGGTAAAGGNQTGSNGSGNQGGGGGENGGSNGENEDFFAIEYICFTAENRTLCVAGACSQVMVFKFNKQECSSEMGVVEVVMNYDDPAQTAATQEPEVVVSGTSSYCQTGTEHPSGGHDASLYYPLRAKTGHHKRLAGFQAELVAISPWIDRRSPPYRILSMSHNMHASLLAYGTENSLIIIDLVQRSVVLNVSTLTLYGPSDPIERGGGGAGKSHSKTTKRCTSAGPYAKENAIDNGSSVDVVDRCRSPVTENTPDLHVTSELETPSHHTYQHHHHLNAIAENPKTEESISSEPESVDNLNSNDNNNDDKVSTLTTDSKDVDKDKNTVDNDENSSLHSIQSIINELEKGMKSVQSTEDEEETYPETEEGTSTATATESPATLQVSGAAHKEDVYHSPAHATISLVDISKPSELKPSYGPSFSMPTGDDNGSQTRPTTTLSPPPPIAPPRTKEKSKFFSFSLGSSSSSSASAKSEKDKKKKAHKKGKKISDSELPSSMGSADDVDASHSRSRHTSGSKSGAEEAKNSSSSSTPRRIILKCRSKPVDFCYASDNEVSAPKRTTTTTEDISSKDLGPISPEPPSSVLQDDDVFVHDESNMTAQEALVFDFAQQSQPEGLGAELRTVFATSVGEDTKEAEVLDFQSKANQSKVEETFSKIESSIETTCKLKRPVMPVELLQFANKSNFVMAKHTFLDFTISDSGSNSSSNSLMKGLMHKLDNFTRSRSSSMSSLESVGSEAVQFLSFANTYMTKNDSTPTPTLWVGTNFGSVIVISLTMPDNYDNRVLCLQTVLATPTPCIFRLKGPILNIGFMDSTGSLLSLKAEQWKDSSASTSGGSGPEGSATAKRTGSLTINRSGSSGSGSKPAKISPSSSSSSDFRDSHLVVITSEKQVRLIAMPLQLCAQKANITETSQAVRADIVHMKTQDALCLAVYVATGNIIVYSLPSLRQLVDVDFLPLTDVRIARTLTFSTNGHGMYLSSPSELTKFTISANFAENLPDMVGALYTAPKELPEPPRQSFLKGFFGGAPTPLDREELFGESNSGKALKTTARLIPGSSEHAKAHTAALGGEFAKLREGFTERGERLGKLEDSTAKMQSEAEAFGSVAHAVMLKYRDKKWYQF